MGGTAITDLPLELLEHILVICDPLDVAVASQVSRHFRDLIYGGTDDHFWRALYLAQAFDDPRYSISYLGKTRTRVKWREELQRIIRARTVVKNIAVCRPDERITTIKNLLDFVSYLPPIPSAESEHHSRNTLWLKELLRDGEFLTHQQWELAEEELQLRYKLHFWLGLTKRDGDTSAKVDSRAFVYSFRNYRERNGWGPFRTDSSGLLNWRHLWAIEHTMALFLVGADEATEATEIEDVSIEPCPLSLGFCQSIIPNGMNIAQEHDWAGVEGLWRVAYCFIDHQDLLVYNDPSLSEDDPLDTSLLESGEIAESYNDAEVYFRVIGVEEDPEHPDYPQINYVGELDGNFTIVGYVKISVDNEIWFHFRAGNQDQPVWSVDGVQVGGVRSTAGVVGSWATVFHESDDPVGPFWMQRIYGIIEE